MSHIAKKVELK